jgi:hypothetical protein
MGKIVYIYDSQGKARASYALQKASAALIDRRRRSKRGIYLIRISLNGNPVMTRVLIVP